MIMYPFICRRIVALALILGFLSWNCSACEKSSTIKTPISTGITGLMLSETPTLTIFKSPGVSPLPVTSTLTPSTAIKIMPVETSTATEIKPPDTDLEYLSSGHIAFVAKGYIGVGTINADGSDLKPLVASAWSSVTWSPDGRQIAFADALGSPPESTQIFLIHPDGSQKTQLTYAPNFKLELAWSPDGQKIAYTETTNTGNSLVIVGVKDGNTSQLAYIPGNPSHLAWSPDGQKIAFLYNQTYDLLPAELRILDLRTGIQKRVIEFPVGLNKIDWSPNGEYIAFSSYQHNISEDKSVENECGDIYIVKPDGSDLKRITDLPGCALSPVWSPDGRYIAFIASKYYGNLNIYLLDWQIFIIKSDGSDLRQLTFIAVEKQWMPVSLAWSRVPGLRTGQIYAVTHLGADLRLHKTASISSEIITNLVEGSQVTVLSDPVDADGAYWRQVKLENGVEGWIKEVAGWLAPVN